MQKESQCCPFSCALCNVISSRLQFIYKKAPGLRNIIAKNVINPPNRNLTFLDRKGFYRCGKCQSCTTTKDKSKKTLTFHGTDGKEYMIRDFINCHTKYVTYLLTCPCGLKYVGCTTRCLFKRINEHVYNISIGYKNHSVSRHFRLIHDRDPSKLSFYGIDRVKPHWRGSDMITRVSQNETYWIYKLNTLQPVGLNIDIDLNCFLTNY